MLPNRLKLAGAIKAGRGATLSQVALVAFALPCSALAQRDTLSVLYSRDSTLVMQYGPILLGTLRRLAEAQVAYRMRRHSYSATLTELEPPFLVPPGVNLALLRADSVRWRAAGVHDSVPGLECRMTGGSPGSLAEDTTPGRLLCRTPGLGVLALSDTAIEFRVPPRGRHKPPATTRSCSGWTLTPQMRMLVREGPHRVLLEFMVGRDGKPETAGLTVIESNGPEYTRVALEVLDRCRFEPAQTNGKPVPVLVDFPVDVRP